MGDLIGGLLGGGGGIWGIVAAIGGLLLVVFGLKRKGGQEARAKLERAEDKRVDRALDAREDINTRVEQELAQEGETYVENGPTGEPVVYVDPDNELRDKWSRD